MNEDRDPALQALFAEANDDLDPNPFTSNVMEHVSNRKVSLLIRVGAVLAALIAILVLLPVDLLSLSVLIVQGFATEIVSLGNGYAAWILAPINNVASVIVLSFKGVRMAIKRARTANYAS